MSNFSIFFSRYPEHAINRDSMPREGDVKAFESLMGSGTLFQQPSINSSSFARSGIRSSSVRDTGSLSDSPPTNQANELSKKVKNAASEHMAQLIVNEINKMKAESTGSAVKKATEIFKDIKF